MREREEDSGKIRKKAPVKSQHGLIVNDSGHVVFVLVIFHQNGVTCPGLTFFG